MVPVLKDKMADESSSETSNIFVFQRENIGDLNLSFEFSRKNFG